MKVYTKLVLNWDFEVLEEESFDYEGPVAQCGGGSGGGSHGSGKVDYPEYMKNKHEKWLNDLDGYLTKNANPYAAPELLTATIIPLSDMRDLNTYGSYVLQRIADAQSLDYVANFADCPYAPKFYRAACSLICWLLDTYQSVYNNKTTNYKNALENFSSVVVSRLAEINNISGLEGTFDLETVVFPRFEAGMRTINAVQMSSFVVGRGVIEGTYRYKIRELQENLKQQVFAAQLEVAKTLSELAERNEEHWNGFLVQVQQTVASLASVAASMASSADDHAYKVQSFIHSSRLQILQLRLESVKAADTLASDFIAKRIEWGRLAVTAGFEQKNQYAEFSEKGARWYLENYQYAANLLAGIGGGTVSPDRRPNRFGSALGGALSGAAAGAMIASGTAVGGPVGALIGGAVGLAGGLLS